MWMLQVFVTYLVIGAHEYLVFGGFSQRRRDGKINSEWRCALKIIYITRVPNWNEGRMINP